MCGEELLRPILAGDEHMYLVVMAIGADEMGSSGKKKKEKCVL